MTCFLRFFFSVIAVRSRVYGNLHRYRIKYIRFHMGVVRVVEQCAFREQIMYPLYIFAV